MEVLDEKPNGGPSTEVEEVVSVRDRKLYAAVLVPLCTQTVSSFALKMKLLQPSICLT